MPEAGQRDGTSGAKGGQKDRFLALHSDTCRRLHHPIHPSGNGNAHPSSSHGDLSARRFPYTHAISDNYPYPDTHAFSAPHARPGRTVPHPGRGRTHRCDQ
jgi:hypothetical protein